MPPWVLIGAKHGRAFSCHLYLRYIRSIQADDEKKEKKKKKKSKKTDDVDAPRKKSKSKKSTKTVDPLELFLNDGSDDNSTRATGDYECL